MPKNIPGVLREDSLHQAGQGAPELQDRKQEGHTDSKATGNAIVHHLCRELARATCVRCHETKCPLLTTFLPSSAPAG